MSEEILSAKEIAEYISEITPEESDVPDYFIKLILDSGKDFGLTKLNVKDLLNQDEDLKDYVLSGEDRYDDEEYSGDYYPSAYELDRPIVVFNDIVVDGYSRVAKHYQNKEYTIYGYVSQ
jgi:hypothetical protein